MALEGLHPGVEDIGIALDTNDPVKEDSKDTKDRWRSLPRQRMSIVPMLTNKDDNEHTTDLELAKYSELLGVTDQEGDIIVYNYQASDYDDADNMYVEKYFDDQQQGEGDSNFLYKDAEGDSSSSVVNNVTPSVVDNVVDNITPKVTNDSAGRKTFPTKPSGNKTYRTASLNPSIKVFEGIDAYSLFLNPINIKSDFSYGTVLIDKIPSQIISELKKVQSKINTELLSEHSDEDGWVKNGLQKKFHITVLYGLKEDDFDRCKEIIKKTKTDTSFDLKLGNLQYFDNRDSGNGVALVVEVLCDKDHLTEVHNILKDNIENADSHEEYKCHMTIAFLKDIPAEELLSEKVEGEWSVKGLSFSNPDGSIKNIEKESCCISGFTKKSDTFGDGVRRDEIPETQINRFREKQPVVEVDKEEKEDIKEKVKKDNKVIRNVPKNLNYSYIEDSLAGGDVFYSDLSLPQLADISDI